MSSTAIRRMRNVTTPIRPDKEPWAGKTWRPVLSGCVGLKARLPLGIGAEMMVSVLPGCALIASAANANVR